jgi:hypothetical protein
MAPAATGQTAVAPTFVTKSVSISTVITIANAIMGPNRMRAAISNPNAQFRTLPIGDLPHPLTCFTLERLIGRADPTTCFRRPAERQATSACAIVWFDPRSYTRNTI